MKKLIDLSRSRVIYRILIALMIAVGCFRVISTYSIFSQTWDESAHSQPRCADEYHRQ
jgi:hypothetical protein